MKEKLKSFIADERSFFGFLLIIVSAFSFWLGRASMEGGRETVAVSSARVSIATQNRAAVQTVSETSAQRTEVVVASRSGTRYHRLDCPGAGQIKPENRVEFRNATTARAAGYTPASNCPGLR